VTEPEFNRLLDLIYEAALQPESWAGAMEAIADALGGTGGALSLLSVADNGGGVITTRVDPDYWSGYFEHFAERNPLHNVPDPGAYMRAWRPKILTDEDWMDKDDLVRSEFYNEFLIPQDMDSVLMIRLAARGYDISVLNIGRAKERGQFQAPQLDIAHHLHPHLIRAYRLSEKVADLKLLNGGMSEALDRTTQALFLLGENGRVCHLNRAAERLLAASGDLRVVGGRLAAGGQDDARRLERLIAAALGAGGGPRSGGSMAVRRPRGLPLSLIVAPIRAESLSVFLRGPAALVCATDLEGPISLGERRLRELFDLSRAEVRVALALFEGMNPREAAEHLGVSFFTVRGHLARIRDKTHTRGQVELARLLTRVGGVSEAEAAG
jgi:DNA-binding CsgD family transcriptional regulator